MYKRQLIDGYSKEAFTGDRLITRYEMAWAISRVVPVSLSLRQLELLVRLQEAVSYTHLTRLNLTGVIGPVELEGEFVRVPDGYAPEFVLTDEDDDDGLETDVKTKMCIRDRVAGAGLALVHNDNTAANAIADSLEAKGSVMAKLQPITAEYEITDIRDIETKAAISRESVLDPVSYTHLYAGRMVFEYTIWRNRRLDDGEEVLIRNLLVGGIPCTDSDLFSCWWSSAA